MIDAARQKYGIPNEVPMSTPWGTTTHGEVVAPGIYLVSTPSHGGYKLLPSRNRQVPDVFRRTGGWYEEDCEAAIVHFFFPEVFGEKKVAAAKLSLRDWYWRSYEEHFGETIPPGQSYKKDRHLFQEANRDNWVVISAGGIIPAPSGMIRCVATKGGGMSGYYDAHDGLGMRHHQVEERTFLVPKDEYKPGRHGFVIDPTRHREI